MSGADSNRVYALVENEKGGLFSSDDAGTTWTLVNDNRNIRQRAFYYTHVTADPVAKDTVYLLNVSAFRSTDGGKTLTNVGRGRTAIITISGSIPTTRSIWSSATTAAARSRWKPARPLAG